MNETVPIRYEWSGVPYFLERQNVMERAAALPNLTSICSYCRRLPSILLLPAKLIVFLDYVSYLVLV